MFSILIPSFNNIDYLKTCIRSIQKNSKYNHQIIVHINEGTDGTLQFVKKNNLEYTFSNKNIGMPKALNKSSLLAKHNYILISHDDFYYCPGWDIEFINELSLYKHNNFYLSGIMIETGHPMVSQKKISPPFFNAGHSIETFDENKLLNNLDKIKTFNFQGSTKCPGLVHKDVWEKVGGWSEEFSPTGGDDSDFAMKLWEINIRIFKGLGNCSVYHFGSITTRKKNKKLFTYLGSRGNKIFLKKWNISINFFEKFYLRSGLDHNKSLIFREYDGPLDDPNKNIFYYCELFKNKLQKLYLILTRF
jgi:GT2 family glycosyltransferase|tara:strand:- start:86 stop:997 length:912 start_codon:yes stop_codon:yes gene_type:complete